MKILHIYGNGKIALYDGVQEYHIIPETNQDSPIKLKKTLPGQERIGNRVTHNGKEYKSMSKAARDTGTQRYWVRRWATSQSNGWAFK